VSDFSLIEALGALIEELHRSLPGNPADSVEVDLSLVARPDRDGVHWRVAGTGDTAGHRIRLVVRPWRQPDRPSSAGSGGGVLDELEIGIEPTKVGNTHLPPIVRPKPGIDMDRNDG